MSFMDSFESQGTPYTFFKLHDKLYRIRVIRTGLNFLRNYYFSSLTASAKGFCERYSLGHWISSSLHATPESTEKNTPWLLTA